MIMSRTGNTSIAARVTPFHEGWNPMPITALARPQSLRTTAQTRDTHSPRACSPCNDPTAKTANGIMRARVHKYHGQPTFQTLDSFALFKRPQPPVLNGEFEPFHTTELEHTGLEQTRRHSTVHTLCGQESHSSARLIHAGPAPL
jgi:hypothetical protein